MEGASQLTSRERESWVTQVDPMASQGSLYVEDGGEGREPSGQCDYGAPYVMGMPFRSTGKRTPHPQWINLINKFFK